MREISRKILKIGEHILIDGIEYVVKEGGCDSVPCELVNKDEDDCDFICRYNTHLEKINKKNLMWRQQNDCNEMGNA